MRQRKRPSAKAQGKSRQWLRAEEMAWLRAHAEEVSQHYAGRWIAIEGNALAAVGDSEEEADEKARAQGIEIPFVVMVRPKGEVWIMGWFAGR